MKIVKRIVWHTIQLFILPLTMFCGITMNGRPYAEILEGMQTITPDFIRHMIPGEIRYAFFDTIFAIPALLASLLPQGFTWNVYWSTFFIGEDLLFMACLLLFAICKMPKLPNLKTA